MPHSSRSWCQSAELRASREHSSPRTSPARASASSVTAGPGSGGRAAGDDAGVVLEVAAQVRWARVRRQAVTPLLMRTPSPSGNALARACRAA
jgi:hypothetical protein